jgi:hypothetical protein
MKYLISSVTIGACLLLSSAGDVFAQNPHPVSPSMGGGQLGTVATGAPMPNGGIASCGGTAPSGGTEFSPPGQAANNGKLNSSPFPQGMGGVVNTMGSVSKYASSTTGHNNSQYDNACLRQAP